ncbi:PREDICTED: histone-lysine N-methyltransferase SETMAR [Ceratosolen solmsi marchali]|uniref:Histone-lysine N-methyltransferase SETMAR n=1 Tax=Ceratosolen solmsi marchali TaxID=326594 RepID=A0AAJ6YCG5_9HYME|nr:PREDICTED: histone-lysine N-methyltransferase SETMAR [Ceratosolen solmsi marchali]
MGATSFTDNYNHLLSDIMYIDSNIPGPGIQIDDFESQFSVGCSCYQICNDDCSCIRYTRNYIDNRLIFDNKSSIIECNPSCKCMENCGNRLVQNGPLDCLTVKVATNTLMGFGLFTTKLIQKGQFICEYAGEVIGIDEAKRRFEENKIQGHMNYVLVVSEFIGEKRIMTCIDPSKFGNIGRYSNHSCQPNAMLVPVRVDIIVPRLCLFAIKDIAFMEEITFNYAGDVCTSNQNFSETPCLCGSLACIGYLPHCPV